MHYVYIYNLLRFVDAILCIHIICICIINFVLLLFQLIIIYNNGDTINSDEINNNIK